MPINTANPFTVNVAQPDMSPVFKGIGELVKGARESSENERIKKGLASAYATGNPDEVAAFMAENPKHGQVLGSMLKFRNEATGKDYDNAIRSILANPTRENVEKVVNARSKFVRAQGGDPTDTEMSLAEFDENPEAFLKDIELAYASRAPKQEWEAYRKSNGFSEVNQHFSGQEIFKDDDGNLFMGTGVGDPSTGTVTPSMVAVDGSGISPVGRLKLVDNQGQTTQETIANKASEVSAKARAKADTDFYTGYIPETRSIESGISDIEMTQDLLNDLSGQADYSTVGFGKSLNKIPLTDATHWNELKSTIQSRLALGKMMELKAASSTGSTGFGALSEKELKLLTDHLGSLEQAQTPKQIKKVVGQIYKSLESTKTGFRKQMRQNRKRFEGLHKEYYGTSRALPSLFNDDAEEQNIDPLGIL